MSSELEAAVALAALGGEELRAGLLQRTVEVARAIMNARAASVAMRDPDTGELVFEAVAGEGEQQLLGTRVPAGQGIAGFVLRSGETLVVEDVAADPRFAADVAARSGYVPRTLAAVPVTAGGDTIGVLSVLDRAGASGFTLAESELLGLFADQAGAALELVRRARRARGLLDGASDELRSVARLAAALEARAEGDEAAALELLDALERVLRA